MSQQFSHSEWVLNLVIEIDAAHAGFCGAFFRTSAERRHVIAAFLARRAPTPEQAAETARFLVGADHHSILKEAYGDAPRGFRGALRRSGASVHEKRFYEVLHKLMAKPRHAEITRCIARFGSLDLRKLRILEILPLRLCSTRVVEALQDVQSASDLIVAFRLLVEGGNDEEQLADSIRAVRDERSLATTVKRALLKCEAPPHPVPEMENYRPIRSARELQSLAAQYRNCARNYTIDLLDPEVGHAFAEVRHGSEGAVVHLRRHDEGWRCEGVYGRSNYRPSKALREHASTYLAQHGIHERRRNRTNTAWDPVRRIASTPLFELEIE